MRTRAPRRKTARGALLAAAALLGAASAGAHDGRPLSVTIVEQAAGVYRTVVRVPPTLQARAAPRLVWPASCEVRESAPLTLALGSTSLVACPAGLEGRSIGIDYPGFNPSITSLFRLEPADGVARTAVLAPDELTWTVPAEADWRTVAAEYTILGLEHIWGGPDHLLFVAGLLLLARRPRRIVYAVTGFTAAHSITLSLATLGLVRAPVMQVEAMIALSIVFLAAEIVRADADGFSRRFPVVLSFVFGLLHGFGFASALGETGLPARDVAMGLAFFNVGVEIGQLAFIAAVVGLAVAGRRLLEVAPAPGAGRPAFAFAARAELIGGYVLGVPAAYWFVERTVSVFAV